MAAAVGCRSGVPAYVWRDLRDSHPGHANADRPDSAPAQTRGGNVCGVGRDRGAPLSDWRVDLLARHLCRARAELLRDSTDGCRAGRRHARRSAGHSMPAGGIGGRLHCASRSRGARVVGRAGALRAVRDIPRRAACSLGMRCVLRRAGGRLALRPRCSRNRSRGFGGRRHLDSGGAMDRSGCARRWPPARDVHRRGAGRFSARQVSARRCLARRCRRARALGHLRHRGPCRRARAPRCGDSAARLRRADAWRSRPHRRRGGDRVRISTPRSVGGDSGAALRPAHGAPRRRRRRPEPAGRTCASGITRRSTTWRLG